MEQNCPLLMKTVIDKRSSQTTGTIINIFCIKENCSWWLEDKQKCAIAVMGGKK